MVKRIDLTGQKFGKLTAIKYLHSDKNGNAIWLCDCDCGGHKEVTTCDLRRSWVRSCGCLLYDTFVTHGLRQSRLYQTYDNMRKRCYAHSCKEYHNYGGRGIKICDEWLDRKNFFDWAANNGYENDLTIDRIDTDGDYSPNNCRWVTLTVQNNNRRNNRIIVFGNQKYTVADFCRHFNVEYWYVHKKLSLGYTPEKIVDAILSGEFDRRRRSPKPAKQK